MLKKQIQWLQTIQNENTALRIATGHTKATIIQHLHSETYMLPFDAHTKMLASQLKVKNADPSHPLNDLRQAETPPPLKKPTIFNSDYTTNVQTCHRQAQEDTLKYIKQNIKAIHTEIVKQYLNDRPVNSLLGTIAPKIHNSEATLPRK